MVGLGFLQDIQLSASHCYLVAAFMAALPLLALPFIDVEDVAKRKQKERLVEIPTSSSAPEG